MCLQVMQRSVVNLTHDVEFSRHSLDSALAEVRRRVAGSDRLPGLHSLTEPGSGSYVVCSLPPIADTVSAPSYPPPPLPPSTASMASYSIPSPPPPPFIASPASRSPPCLVCPTRRLTAYAAPPPLGY